VDHDAGVGAEQVDASVRGEGGLDQMGDVGFFAHVGRDWCGADGCGLGFSGVLAQVGEHHLGALAGEAGAEFEADAAGAAGDHRDLPMYIHVPRILDNSVDLAVVEALRYGRCLRADELTALHFVIEADPAALLRRRWEYYELEKPLRVIDCPDRRLTRAAQELVWRARAEYRNTNVTVLLPRRGYAPLLGQVPDPAATIVPYDVQSRIRQAFPDPFEERVTREVEKVQARITERDQQRPDTYDPLPRRHRR
jgi:hypothetical protein